MCDGYGGQRGQYPWYAQTVAKPFPIPKRYPSCEHQGKHNIHVYIYMYMYNIIYTCKWSQLFHAVHCLPSRLLLVGDATIHRSRPGYFSQYKTINYNIKKIKWHVKFNKSSKTRGVCLFYYLSKISAEIDKARFGRWKYHRGGHWVASREGRTEMFLVPVPQ